MKVVRRLRKLESRLTDETGLVPRSEAWLDYWKRKLHQYVVERGGIPMEAVDAIDRAGGSEELENWLFAYAKRQAATASSSKASSLIN